jgi:hypothetical protein
MTKENRRWRARVVTMSLVAIGIGLVSTPAAEALQTTTSGGAPGYDVSYPQCGKTLPSSPAFGIVGVNNGILYSANPCLGSELGWAQQAANHAPAFYANTADPGPAYSSHWPTIQTTPQSCDPAANNSTACSYDYGWNGAKDSFAVAVAAEQQVNGTSVQTATVVAAQAPWWLDIETGNSWQTLESAYGQSPTSQANDVASLDGAIAYLQSVGVSRVGLYSTSYQWGQITGGTGSHFTSNPDWVAGYSSQSSAQAGCTSAGFAGGPVALTQYPSNGFDADQACPSPTPDFSLSVSPSSQSVVQVSSTSYAVTVTPTNGFNSPVSLSVSGLPATVSSSFVPPSTTSSSALTLTPAATTAIGTYPFTITGVSGALTHTTSATLVVNPAGSFTIGVAPPSQSVVQGAGTSYTVTVTPESGFTSAVSLSVNGLPAGASASFSPNPAVSPGYSSTLSVTTGSSTPTGPYTLTVNGTSGNLTRTTTASLTVTAAPRPVLHVASVHAFKQLNSRNWSAWGDVTILDQKNQPVAGVTVTLTFTGGAGATLTCVTNSSGYCSTSSNKVRISNSQPSETVTATNVVKTGDTWDNVKVAATVTR